MRVALLLCGIATFPAIVAAQNANSTPLQFVPLQSPCRAVDTRLSGGPIASGTSRNFNPAGGACNIPGQGSGPIAYAMNVTVVPHGSLGYLTVWPAGEPQPVASTLNATDGRVKANAAIIPGGSGGEVSVYAGGASTDVILDVSGYFIATTTSFVYVPITPCRMVDTRNSPGELGGPSLVAGQQRAFEVASAVSCNLPVSRTENGGAVSLTVTAVPIGGHTVSYVTVWGTSVETQTPLISTLNAPTGTVVANAAIIPINPGTYGSLSVYATDNTDLIVDITGYFLPASQVSAGLSLYTLTPCRVLDTRLTGEALKGELTVPFTSGNSCSLPNNAEAFAVNATVVPTGTLGYLALWPDGLPQPLVSTLNAADGFVTSNMAIVGSSNGSIDTFASDPTQLILDVSGYFASVPGWTLVATPNQINVQPGGSFTFSLLASPLNQFTTTVPVTFTPTAGLTVSPSTVNLVPGVAQTITVSATSDATNGSIAIQASAQGVTQSLEETVNLGPNFSIEFNFLNSGGLTDYIEGYFDVTNFYSNVTAQLTGFPAGVLVGGFIGPPFNIPASPGPTLLLGANCPGASGLGCTGTHFVILYDGAAAGTYPLTLTATSGAITHTESLSLTVTPPVTNLSITPATASIAQGGTQTVNLTGTGYIVGHPGSIINLAGLPTGVSFSTAWNSNGPTPIVFTASPSAAVGTYTVTVTTSTPISIGWAEGPAPNATATTQFSLSVVAP